MKIYHCWKFLLLHFKADIRTKYALEAFHLIAQVKALLTLRVAHQLLWNLVCNPHGGTGKNIPLDLQEEYLNRLIKDDVNTFRENISDHSVNRMGQSNNSWSTWTCFLPSMTQVTSTISHMPKKTSKPFWRNSMETTYFTKYLEVPTVVTNPLTQTHLQDYWQIQRSSTIGWSPKGSSREFNRQ